VREVLALRVATRLLDLVRLGPEYSTRVREEQQPVMGGRAEEVLDDVVRAKLGALDSLAPAVLAAVVVTPRALDVAATRDGDDHLLFRDQVFDAHVAVEAEHDLGAAIVPESLDDLLELFSNDRALFGRSNEDA